MWWVYVDGACKNNGQPDAAAGYGVWFGKNHELNVSEVVSGLLHSNNVAELQAAKAAIEIAIREGFDGLKIYTDSEYVFKGNYFKVKGNIVYKWYKGVFFTLL